MLSKNIVLLKLKTLLQEVKEKESHIRIKLRKLEEDSGKNYPCNVFCYSIFQNIKRQQCSNQDLLGMYVLARLLKSYYLYKECACIISFLHHKYNKQAKDLFYINKSKDIFSYFAYESKSYDSKLEIERIIYAFCYRYRGSEILNQLIFKK